MHRRPILGGGARAIWGLLLLLSTFQAALAQDDKTVFEKTIDAFNRTTTRYVLAADQEKKEAAVLAKQLADPAYDLKNLQADLRKIYDDNSKTETLSNTISKQKSNFIQGKPLAAQFATVIQLIRDDRKGKPYLAALEKDLIDIKERALKEGISAPVVPATSAVQTDEIGQLKARIDDLQQKLDTLSTSNAMAASSGIPLYIPLLLTLVVMLSGYNFWMLQRLKNRKRSSSSSSSTVVPTVANSTFSAEEVNQKIKEKTASLEKMMETLRNQMKRDMEELRREMHKSNDRKQNFSKDKPSVTPITQNPPATNAVNPHANPPNVTPPVQKANTTPVTAAGVVTPGQTINLEVKKPVSREPEKPREIRKYADYPKENGFVIAQLYDSSDRRSIYQLSIPEEGDKASFSIVNDPAIHEYAIQNRERLLKDACDFEISSSKHTRIEVIQPGTLKLDGNAWQIHTKAQIKFV